MQVRRIRLAMVQQAFGTDSETNLSQSMRAVAEAANKGARLILLSELHRTRYFCQSEDHVHFKSAESIPGPSTDRLSTLAQRHKVVIIASIFERRTAGIYHNTAVVIDRNGDIAGCYRKMHIPDDPGYNEKFYFTPGDQGFEPIETSLGKLGVLICWDQWFPEAARLMALKGAEILLYPTAIGWDRRDDAQEQQRQRDAWRVVQRGHAVANGIPLMVCNRVGFESNGDKRGGGIQFWGSSFIAGQQGEILAEAASHQEAVISAEIDLGRNETIRQNWPFLRDRRIDHYHGLNQIHLESSKRNA